MKFQSDAFLGLVFDLNDHSLSISFSFTPARVERKKSFPSLTWQVFHSPNKDSAAKLYKKAEMDSTPKKHKQWNLD